ncbi:MAG: peptide chain release factor N(5)-glutamine methyltransferase [Rikenellaceae bacterium]
MTIREVIDAISQAAMEVYGEAEAKQIGRIMVMELGHYTPTQLVIWRDEECRIDNIEEIIAEVKSSRPIQYIVGSTEFCSLEFKVAEGVLIPRPETEELVWWIVEDHKSLTPRIVDVGSGSGAIAVSLAKNLLCSEVWSVDISSEALVQARTNGELNGVNVNFVEGDALLGVERYLPDVGFDIVVSNPPYIPRSEGESMRQNVMDFEPHVALFVDDAEPLIFYRKISESAQKLLTNGGKLYFEIHENFAPQMVEMLESMGYINIICREDINQKPRMICAQKP